MRLPHSIDPMVGIAAVFAFVARSSGDGASRPQPPRPPVDPATVAPTPEEATKRGAERDQLTQVKKRSKAERRRSRNG